MRPSTHLASFVVAFGLVACSSTSSPSSTADAGTTPTPDQVAVSATLACNDGPTARKPVTVGASKLERCLYRPSLPRLDIQVDDGLGGDFVMAQIASFSGVGKFTTSKGMTDEDTFVEMRAASTDVSSEPTDKCPVHVCTLEVTEAGVVTAGKGGTGTLAIDVDCPKLGGAATECLECTVSPVAFHLEIAACARDD